MRITAVKHRFMHSLHVMDGFIALLIAMAVLAALPAHAANWQTPAEAAQFAAMESGTMAPVAAPISTATPRFFQISKQDVGDAVAKQMQQQGFRQQVTATVDPSAETVLHSADHPLKLAIHALQVDTESRRWQAQAYVLNGNTTEVVKPITGRYDATLSVPVLTRQLRAGDVIESADIEMRTVPERQLRKDTVTDSAKLIGQSPTRMISAGRAIRAVEVTMPKVITKGQLVEMHYTTPYMNIRTSGEALEDGAPGQMIRIKNTKSEKAISARVVAAGKVEVNTGNTL